MHVFNRGACFSQILLQCHRGRVCSWCGIYLACNLSVSVALLVLSFFPSLLNLDYNHFPARSSPDSQHGLFVSIPSSITIPATASWACSIHSSIHSFIEKQLTHSPPLAHSLVPSPFLFLSLFLSLFLYFFPLSPLTSEPHPPLTLPPFLEPPTPHKQNKTKTGPESASEQMSYRPQANKLGLGLSLGRAGAGVGFKRMR